MDWPPSSRLQTDQGFVRLSQSALHAAGKSTEVKRGKLRVGNFGKG